MAGSRKCFDIFELPERRGINRRISEESLMALFPCSFVTQQGLIGEEFVRILRLRIRE
jgi:hypothetical protein